MLQLCMLISVLASVQAAKPEGDVDTTTVALLVAILAVVGALLYLKFGKAAVPACK